MKQKTFPNLALLGTHFVGLYMIFSTLSLLAAVSPDRAYSAALLASLLAVGGLAWGGCLRSREVTSSWRWTLGAGLIFFAVLNWQLGELDDDYWIHTPLQGLLQRNGLPPVHPFIPGIQLGGHCGRDLVIAGLSGSLGCYCITVQIWLTAFAHASGFLLLRKWLGTYKLPGVSQVLAMGLFYLGVCVGSRYGFLDAYQNNNSVAFNFAFLALYSWRNGPSDGRRYDLSFFLALSYLGICYEMLWGLVVLTAGLVGLAGCLRAGKWAKSSPDWGLLLRVVAAIIASAVLVMLCSGSLKSVLESTVSKADHNMDMRQASQRQTVVVKFPKRDFGFVYVTPLHSSAVSIGFRLFPRLEAALQRTVDADQRVFVYSWRYLRQHWLATWLVPVTLFIAYRLRCGGTMTCLLLGWLSLTIPAVVDFGAAYEHENFRWSYVAGCFFALALGIASGKVLSQSRSWWANLLAVLPFVCCVLPGSTYYRQRLTSAWCGCTSRLSLAFDGLAYYRCQPILGFSRPMQAAAEWLAEHGKGGETMVTDIPFTGDMNVLEEANFIGFSQLQSIGHSMPVLSDSLGTPPFRYLAWHRVFWASPNLTTLQAEGVRWVVQSRMPDRIGVIPGLNLVAEFQDETQHVKVFEVASLGEKIQTKPLPLSFRPEGLQCGQILSQGYVGWLKIANHQPAHDDGQVVCRVIFEPKDDLGVQEEYRWGFPSSQKEAKLPLVTPSQPGKYRGRIVFSCDPKGHSIRQFEYPFLGL